MGWYQRHLAPRIIDLACSPAALGSWRRRVVEDLEGTVVEIGFGTGRNLPFYPSGVDEIIAVEPSSHMRRRGLAAAQRWQHHVTFGDLDGQQLTLPDASMDAGVVTFALCSIPDPLSALRELRRVIRPGGTLRVLEHGLAPDANVVAWQQRIEPLERRIADGCHLTRDAASMVSDAGWHITALHQAYVRGPKPWSYFTSLQAN
jgi:ubiquinone/menaquinone biosynthesis C-methylase UbiE